MEQISPPRKRFYYGWVIVGLSMLSMAFWFGFRTAFSVFFVALIDDFKWGRAEGAGAQSVAMFAYMVMAPVMGTLVDRIGPRKVLLPGIILAGFHSFSVHRFKHSFTSISSSCDGRNRDHVSEYRSVHCHPYPLV